MLLIFFFETKNLRIYLVDINVQLIQNNYLIIPAVIHSNESLSDLATVTKGKGFSQGSEVMTPTNRKCIGQFDIIYFL